MTRDDIRKLIGGYATGSLTDAERKILFEAALDDQELFDELAREQALKETLDQPGAKRRLIAALESRPPAGRAWWKQPAAWTAVAAAVALAVGLTTWTLLRAPKPVQFAVVQVPLAPPNESPAVDATEPKSETRAAPKTITVRKTKAQPVVADRKDQPEPEAKPETKKDAPAPAPPPAPIQPEQQAQPKQQQEAATQAQVHVQAQAQTGFRDSGAVGGVGGNARRIVPAPAGPAFAPLLAKANRFGFDFAFEPGSLTIKTTAAGTLTVTAATCLTCDGFASLLRTNVEKDSTAKIPVASQYVVLAITFSAQKETVDTQAPTVAITRTARIGMVEDPNPSPNSKIALRLELR